MNAWPLVSQELVHRIGWTLVHSTWEGLLVAAGLAIALRLLRNSAATKRYAASCLAMALIVAANGVTFEESAQTPSPPIAQRAAPLAPSRQLSAAPAPLSIAIQPINTPHRDILDDLVIAWSAGVVLMAIWHLGGWLWLLRLRRGNPLPRYEPALRDLANRLGITRIVRLIETTRLDVPAVIGFLRPVILIPIGVLNDLTPQQIEAILAHELAHVRRHDYLVNLLQAVIETLLFYHPAVWWISNRMRAERENCCDDIAADLCGDKRTYAAALAALEARRGLVFNLAPAATGGELLARVRRLLQSASPAPRGYARSVAIASLVILILAGGVVGWSLLRSPREHTVDLAKADKNKTDKPTVEVLVGAESLLYEGTPLDWDQIETKIAAIPAERRHQTVISVAASSGSIPIQRYFDATNHLSELATKYGLAYVSQTGIKPTTNPSADLPPGTEVGEYYMDGHVRRPGVYNLSGRKISLRQALVAAGGADAGFEKSLLDVIRRNGDVESLAAENVAIDDVMNGRAQPFFLKPNDVIRVGKTPATSPATQQAILNPPPDPSQPGEYYIDGEIPRAGVYSMTGRKITLKQALVAAGGLGAHSDLMAITVTRRSGKDEESVVLDQLSADDLLQNRHSDIYIWPNDIIQVALKSAGKLSIDAIAAVDPTMRDYVKTGDTLQFRYDQICRVNGVNSRVAQDAKAELDLQKQRIDKYAAEYRKHGVNIQGNRPTAIPPTEETGSQLKARQNPPASQPATAPSATQPLIRREDQEALQSLQSCMSNLRYVDTAILFYGEQNGGNLPADLGATLKYLPTDLKWSGQQTHWTQRQKGLLYVCPDDAKAVQSPDQPTADWINQNTSYVYLGAANVKMNNVKGDWSKIALAYEKRATGHEGSVPVLFVDGHVEAVSKDALPAIVNASKPAFETATTRAATTQSSASPPAGSSEGATSAAILAERIHVQLDLAEAQRLALEDQDRILAARLGDEHPQRQTVHARLKRLDEEIARLSSAATANPATSATPSLPPDLIVLLRQRAQVNLAIWEMTNLGGEARIVVNYQNTLDRIDRKIAEFTTPSATRTAEQ